MQSGSFLTGTDGGDKYEGLCLIQGTLLLQFVPSFILLNRGDAGGSCMGGQGLGSFCPMKGEGTNRGDKFDTRGQIENG